MTRWGWLVVGLVSLGVPRLAHAVDRFAASCDFSAVNAQVSIAVTDDVVHVPAGDCTWTSGLEIFANITLSGAGIGQTIIRANIAAGSTPLVTMWISGSALARITGFTFDGASDQVFHRGTISLLGNTSPNVRFDHNEVYTTYADSVGVLFYSVLGVVDHNIFHSRSFSNTTFVEHPAWKGVGQFGHGSWAQPANFGSDEFLFFENNTFEGPGYDFNWFTDGDEGTRFVWRYNTITNLNWIVHGTDSNASERGGRAWEVYKNSFNYNPATAGAYFGWAVNWRSGSGILWDNTVTSVNTSIFGVSDLRYLRSDASEREPAHTYWPFSICYQQSVSLSRSGSTVTATTPGYHRMLDTGPPGTHYAEFVNASDSTYNGVWPVTGSVGNPYSFTFFFQSSAGASSATATIRSPYDGNQLSNGYPCLDQQGRGAGDLYVEGPYPPGGPDPGSIRSMNQEREPGYIWNNFFNGDLSAAIVSGGDTISENRDFFNQSATFTSNPFSGMGRGPIGQRPTSCGEYTAWWATDEGEWDSSNGPIPDGQLYRCLPANTWSLYYTPFTYPHPLVGGDVTPTPNPPGVPILPNPFDGATHVSRAPLLRATSTNASTYDFAFGTCPTPPTLVSGISSNTYSPGAISPDTVYCWRMTAHNTEGTEIGTVWDFTSGPVGEFVYDSFTDANGIAANAHRGENATWLTQPGTSPGFVVSSQNRARNNTAFSFNMHQAGPVLSTASYDVTCVLFPFTIINYVGCGGRASAVAASAYFFNYDASAGSFVLLKLSNGVTSVLDDTCPIPLVAGVPTTAVLKLRTNSQIVEVNGTNCLAAQDPDFTEAGHVVIVGFGAASDSTGIHLETIYAEEATDMPEPPEPPPVGSVVGRYRFVRNVAAASSSGPGLIAFVGAPYSVAENAGTATVTLTRFGGDDGAVGVTFATSNGTALQPGDYTALSTTVTWADGDMANKTVSITVINDADEESAETVNLALSSATGGVAIDTPSTSVLTITNDDEAGLIQLTSGTYTVAEAGGTATITLTRTVDSDGAVSVSIASSNGTASQPGDYTALSTTVTWTSGDMANKTVSVTIINDATDESNETVTLTISSPTNGATLGSPTSAVLTITDDDAPAVVDFGGYRPHYQGFGTGTVPGAYGAAFPQQGNNPGGRGGTIYRVNTLSDNTTAPVAVGDGTFRCSFRACVTQAGPRIIVFETSGVIDLTALGWITINSPFLTIAGQTAPSPGISIRGATVFIAAHDTVVQHLRFRFDRTIGTTPQHDAVPLIIGTDGNQPLTAANYVYNIVLDHVSVAFANGYLSVLMVGRTGSFGLSANPWDVAILDSIISYPLQTDTFTGGGGGSYNSGFGVAFLAQQENQYTFARNLIAHCSHRCPLFQGMGKGQGVNNLVYGSYGELGASDATENAYRIFGFNGAGSCSETAPVCAAFTLFINNRFLPSTGTGSGVTRGTNPNHLTFTSEYLVSHATVRGDRLWLQGNEGPGITGPTMSGQWTGIYHTAEAPTQAQLGATAEFAWHTSQNFVTIPTADMPAYLLAHAGARPQDRDSVDAAAISQTTAAVAGGAVTSAWGSIIQLPADLGVSLTLAANTQTFTVPASPHSVSSDPLAGSPAFRTNMEVYLETLARALE